MQKENARSWHHQCVQPARPGQNAAASLCPGGGIHRRSFHWNFSSRDRAYPRLSRSAAERRTTAPSSQALSELHQTTLKRLREVGRVSEVLGTY